MKRYINNKKRWIEIVVYIDPSLPQEIAAVDLHHPSSKFKLTDEELLIYSDFVESMISPMQARGFKIIKEYQSNKSYAYYVDFYPVDKQGNLLDEIHVVFRIADHDLSHGRQGAVNSERFIKSFTINNLSYDKMLPFIQRIGVICDHLQEGDYDELLIKPTEFE